jgi:hypothetical protein
MLNNLLSEPNSFPVEVRINIKTSFLEKYLLLTDQDSNNIPVFSLFRHDPYLILTTVIIWCKRVEYTALGHCSQNEVASINHQPTSALNKFNPRAEDGQKPFLTVGYQVLLNGAKYKLF